MLVFELFQLVVIIMHEAHRSALFRFSASPILEWKMLFLKSQKVLIAILTCFGFFAYNANGNLESSLSRKCFCVVINCFSVVQYLIFAIKNIQTFNDFLGDGSFTTATCHNLEAISVEFIYFWIIYSISFTHKEQILFLKRLATVEEIISTCNREKLEDSYCRLRITANVMIFSCFAFFFCLSSVYAFILSYDEGIFYVFITMLSSVYFTLIVIFLDNLVNIIRELFEIINFNLNQFINRSDFYHKDIQVLLKTQVELINIIEDFSQAFGLLVLALFVYFSGCTAIESYFAYVTILFDLTKKSVKFEIYSICNVLWAFSLILVLHRLGLSCSKVLTAIDESKIILRTIDIRDVSRHLIDRHFVSLSTRNINFTSRGFFVIDGSIIYNVTRFSLTDSKVIDTFFLFFQLSTAVITFLVVFIQFHQMEMSKQTLN